MSALLRFGEACIGAGTAVLVTLLWPRARGPVSPAPAGRTAGTS
jgi:hypothetical protein